MKSGMKMYVEGEKKMKWFQLVHVFLKGMVVGSQPLWYCI